jgi:hypothetical protein
MRTDVGGNKRLKLLTLIAAYADANEPSPAALTLCRTLKIDIVTLDRLLKRLEQDGHIEVAWQSGRDQRNVYTVHVNGGAT